MKHRVPGAIATFVLVVALAYLATAGLGYAVASVALAFTLSGLVWGRSRRLAAESSLLEDVSAELIGAQGIDDVWARAATTLGRFLEASRVVVYRRNERQVYRLWKQYASDDVRPFDDGASLSASPFEMGRRPGTPCTVVWLGAADEKRVALAVYPAYPARADFIDRFAEQVNRIAEAVGRCRTESRLGEVRSGLLRFAHALASAHEWETVLDLAVSAGPTVAGCEKGAVFVESASVGWRTAFEKGFGAELTPAFLSRLIARLDEAVGQRGPLKPNDVAGSLLVVPMFHGRELMGVLLLGRTVSSPVWDDADLEAARILGQLTATALKNARQSEALSTAIAGYDEIANRSFDLHVMLDETGTIRSCNAQASRAFGSSRLDLVGRRFEDLVDRDFVHRWRQLQRELFQKGSLSQVSTKLKTDDENDLEVVLNAFAPSPDEARLVLNDVTELRRLENQLRHSQRQEVLGLLASGVAHDLNNVLGGVLGYASLARYQTQDPRVTKYVETIERTAMRGASLTGRLLSSSRRSSPRQEPVSLNQLIGETLELLAHSMPKNVRIETSLDPSVRVIMADSAQLQQILLNLAINARDAMRDGGVLRLSTRLETDARVCISVQDTGVGMDSKVLERLYEPFFSTKGPKGTGLGLSVVYGIVKSLSGDIRVQSSPGRGTRFDVFLTCRWADEAAPAREVDEPVGHGELVLLVDDEEVLRDLGKDILETHGYRVQVVSSGEEAVDFIRRSKESVALVVLDLVMPGIDGGETYRRLRHLDAGLPVLLSSGLTAEQSVEEILTDRATGFLEKPYGQSELARAVRSTILRKRRSIVVH
ncbi:MAG TPA: ATP-binding protein [Vicinamibacteria bacterium]|nr:ATP-binding protein [Vicinamibacteria bacterium]